ncbi:MAG TPA: ERAP1-like C-terminal domain-containing protein, partial [Kribbella sp.]
PIRWRLLTRLVALDFAGPHQIDAEQAKDPDPDATWHAAAARAATPTARAKDTALNLLLTPPGIPASVLRTFATALWQPRQTDVLADRPVQFLERLITFAESTDPAAANRLARYAFPVAVADNSTLTRARQLAATGTTPVLRQTLQDQADLTHRALTCWRSARR